MTKKIFLVVFFALILSSKLLAEKVKGKIILENDTIDVTFDIPVDYFSLEINYESLQQRIKYIDSTGNKKVLHPEDAKEIRFKYEFENIRMLSRENSLLLGNPFSRGSHIFLKLEIDGRLKLFKYYHTQHIGGGYNSGTGTVSSGSAYSSEGFILQKENTELKKIKRFKKDMPEYFSDCTKLVEKIENKEFSESDMDLIVKFYNSKCK
ncbi:hypothetical protein [Sporocytophaga myxococcoides]|uniref:hypothetical protein n=1 Tax=Sporocytophaga myxococcoides TaxID=153721 RepID=UPI000401FCC4|nr:hypothetical protein [Sporocytophaga myxococcoides]